MISSQAITVACHEGTNIIRRILDKFAEGVAGPRLQPHFYGGTMEICLDKLQIMIDIQMTMFGFNYKTLGLAVGVHPSYLRDIPSGKRVATESTAGNLVKFFGEQILK